jgi:hypothetical protein
MSDVARAIRLELQRYGPTLKDIPTPELKEIAQIVTAFSYDLKGELATREEET